MLSLTIKKLLNQFFKLIGRPKFIQLGPILFLSFNISANLINKKVTAFSWVPDPVKPLSGKCYEYDIETGGKSFQAVTRKSRCKPKQTEFLWIASEKGIGGKCYEVDTESKGAKYASATATSKCVTKEMSYVWEVTSEISGECYQIDGDLKRKTSKSNCAPKSIEHRWLPRDSGWGGKCFAIDAMEGPAGYIESVNTENCRPSDTSYTLHLKKEGEQGYCYEVDSNEGAKSYSRRVSRENCFNDVSPKYMWKKDKRGIGGECLEVRNSIDQKTSARNVDYKNCIRFKTRIFFKKTTKFGGICLLIDDPTSGEEFSKSLAPSRCREVVKELQYTIVANEYGKPICVESDTETGGELFVGKVSLSKCEDTSARPKWILSEDGWTGKCVELRTLGDKVREKAISKEKCRPVKTRFTWHNFKKLDGKCFEVDAEKGNSNFVTEASLKKCAPKFTKYIFFREKGKSAGNCYLVDRETSGEKFNKQVGTKKCRENLIKVPL